jgi:hypothetical protein
MLPTAYPLSPEPSAETTAAQPPDLLSLRALGRAVAALAVLWVALITATGVGLIKLEGAENSESSTSLLFMWWALLAFVPLWMAVRPPPRVGVLSASVAIALTAILELAAPKLWPYTPVVGSGLACMGALAMYSARGPDTHRSRSRYALLTGLILCLYVLLSGFPLSFSAQSGTVPVDFVAYAGDEALGGQFSQWVESLFLAAPALAQLCFHVYNAVALGLAAILAWQIAVRESPTRGAVLSFLIAGALGHTIYLLFPVIGPRFLFGLDGPYVSATSVFPSPVPLAAELVLPAVIPSVPRNCMPSLHTGWALLVFWQSRAFGWRGRFFGASFLVLTMLATLGFGLHYLVDLIAAVPFAAALHAFFTPRGERVERARRHALLVSGVSFVAWLLLVRFGTRILSLSTVLAWALAAVACVPSLVLEARLLRQAREAQEALAR